MNKLLRWFIVASLAFNAAFAILFLRHSSPGAISPTAATAAAPSPATQASPTTAAPQPETWASLPAAELPSLLADLRAAGYPKETIRAILAALINQQFAARRKALDPDGETRPFWKDRAPDPSYQMARLQVDRDQQNALRDLLGPDADSDDPMTIARQKQRFGNLAPEKMLEAQNLVRTFEDRRQAVYSSGTFTATERDKLAELDKEQRAALAQILSPSELEEYDFRNSNTGRQLRTELTAFQPTEAEFRAIFALRQPFDELAINQNSNGLPSQEQMAQQGKAREALKAQIVATLGPQRGAEYELTTDFNYRRVSQVVARLDLPPETTRQLSDTQKEYQQRMSEIRRSTPNPEERTAQLTALQQEATARLGGMLGGSEGLEAYKQYGGSWLQSMLPRPPPPRP
jgi:hypothetical protein